MEQQLENEIAELAKKIEESKEETQFYKDFLQVMNHLIDLYEKDQFGSVEWHVVDQKAAKMKTIYEAKYGHKKLERLLESLSSMSISSSRNSAASNSGN